MMRQKQRRRGNHGHGPVAALLALVVLAACGVAGSESTSGPGAAGATGGGAPATAGEQQERAQGAAGRGVAADGPLPAGVLVPRSEAALEVVTQLRERFRLAPPEPGEPLEHHRHARLAPETTYVVGVQCDIWLVVDGATTGRYAQAMRRDVAALIKGAGDGYTYELTGPGERPWGSSGHLLSAPPRRAVPRKRRPRRGALDRHHHTTSPTAAIRACLSAVLNRGTSATNPQSPSLTLSDSDAIALLGQFAMASGLAMRYTSLPRIEDE